MVSLAIISNGMGRTEEYGRMKKFFTAIIRYFKQTDILLMLFSLAASMYGLVLIYSATMSMSSHKSLVVTQIIAIGIGVVAMIVLSKIDYHTIGDWWKIIAAVSVLLLLYTLIWGKGPEVSEDKSWIIIGGRSLQPAEFIKIAFVITFSKHFDMVKDNLSSVKNVALLCLHGAVPIGIIVLQKDMGMALVYIVIFISMLFVSNIKLRYFAGGAILLMIATPIIWNLLFGDTQRNRILALLDPNNDDFAKQMYQQNLGITALASGKLWGYGLLNGPKTQSVGSLPERQNDFIFAATGEELGFIGCIVVMIILSLILIRIIVDSTHSKDAMGSMICIGIFASFAIQIMINIGMVLRLLPVVGLTLPFFSSGGSSVLSAFLAVGMVLSVYMHRKNLMFAEQTDKI